MAGSTIRIIVNAEEYPELNYEESVVNFVNWTLSDNFFSPTEVTEVIPATDKRFFDDLNMANEWDKGFMDTAFSVANIKDDNSKFFDMLKDIDKINNAYDKGEDPETFMALFGYNKIIGTLIGSLAVERCIYDVSNKTTRIKEHMVEGYKANPENYFMYVVEYHF